MPEKKKKKEPQKYYVGKQEVSKEEYLSARAKMGFKTPRTGTPPLLERKETPTVKEAVKEYMATPKEQEEIRREAFREETGAGELAAELEEKIETPPSMKPAPIITPEIAQVREFQPLGISATGAVAKLLENPKKELKRAGVELTIGAVAGVGALSLGFLSQLIAKSTITKAVLGKAGSVPILKATTAGLGIYLVGPKVFDYRGDEMETYRGMVQKVIEDGERIEASARNGFPTEDTIELLSTITAEVDNAEKRIKELGVYNLQYRVSKEYLLDQSKVRSARIALLRRIEAVENIAATGTGALRPEELLFEVEQFRRGGGELE